MVNNFQIYYDILNNLNKLNIKNSKFKILKKEYEDLKAYKIRNFIFYSERIEFIERELEDSKINFRGEVEDIKQYYINSIKNIKLDSKKSQLYIELKVKKLEFDLINSIIQTLE